MREIKFRAWDKKRKEMLRITMMDFAEWWVSCRPPGTQADSLEYGERNSFKNEETDRHILMQFTGLRDKNGKKIWQSDFIKGHGTGFSTTHSEVHFAHNGAQIEIGDHWIQLSKFIEIEVIGHKYQEKKHVLR